MALAVGFAAGAESTWLDYNLASKLAHLVALIATIGTFSTTCITAGTFHVDPPADDPPRQRSGGRNR